MNIHLNSGNWLNTSKSFIKKRVFNMDAPAVIMKLIQVYSGEITIFSVLLNSWLNLVVFGDPIVQHEKVAIIMIPGYRDMMFKVFHSPIEIQSTIKANKNWGIRFIRIQYTAFQFLSIGPQKLLPIPRFIPFINIVN